MPKPRVAFVRSVVARTVPETSGLKMPAASPMESIVSAMPENDLVRISSRIDGRYARYEMMKTGLNPYLSASVPENSGTTYESRRKIVCTTPS